VPSVTGMTEELTIRRVEVSFVGRPPTQVLQRTRGVSNIETEGPVLRCLVCGSFQPFLEALRGHEVIAFESTPEPECERP
jgi:hypothetical protein